jgi:branched-chain amino acid transport system ATP-binding protein
MVLEEGKVETKKGMIPVQMTNTIVKKTDGQIVDFDHVKLEFGGLTALNDVSFKIPHNKILAIIGPNGAGKTCILNCISGYYRPQAGQILYHGSDLVRVPRHKIAKMGIARTFQNIELFDELTVIENILLGRHYFIRSNMLAQALFFGWYQKEEIKHRRAAEEILDFLELKPHRKKVVGALPYGLKKRIQLGVALAMEPKILLLDEPMAGMNLEEKEDIARFILDVNEEGKIGIVLIEHDMGVVMDIADRVVVIDFGLKIAEGTPDEIKTNERVINAYLGVK